MRHDGAERRPPSARIRPLFIEARSFSSRVGKRIHLVVAVATESGASWLLLSVRQGRSENVGRSDRCRQFSRCSSTGKPGGDPLRCAVCCFVHRTRVSVPLVLCLGWRNLAQPGKSSMWPCQCQRSPGLRSRWGSSAASRRSVGCCAGRDPNPSRRITHRRIAAGWHRRDDGGYAIQLIDCGSFPGR